MELKEAEKGLSPSLRLLHSIVLEHHRRRQNSTFGLKISFIEILRNNIDKNQHGREEEIWDGYSRYLLSCGMKLDAGRRCNPSRYVGDWNSHSAPSESTARFATITVLESSYDDLLLRNSDLSCGAAALTAKVSAIIRSSGKTWTLLSLA